MCLITRYLGTRLAVCCQGEIGYLHLERDIFFRTAGQGRAMKPEIPGLPPNQNILWRPNWRYSSLMINNEVNYPQRNLRKL